MWQQSVPCISFAKILILESETFSPGEVDLVITLHSWEAEWHGHGCGWVDNDGSPGLPSGPFVSTGPLGPQSTASEVGREMVVLQIFKDSSSIWNFRASFSPGSLYSISQANWNWQQNRKNPCHLRNIISLSKGRHANQQTLGSAFGMTAPLKVVYT